jgi:DNA-directed RNA polymerase I, II, and III subunit RPABC1
MMEQTLEELLRDRGCSPGAIEKKEDSWLAKLPEPALPIRVYFVRGQKVGIDEIRSFAAEENKYSALIIIYDDDITPSAKVAKSRKMQLFHINELAFNITKHVLVPEHQLLSSSEADAFFEKLRAKKEDLPRILATDPVIKYYGWSVGRLVRVKRRFGVQVGDYDYVRVITRTV